MITYIPYIPIALPQTHYGGGTVIPLYVFLAIYIAVIVYLIIEIFKRFKDL